MSLCVFTFVSAGPLFVAKCILNTHQHFLLSLLSFSLTLSVFFFPFTSSIPTEKPQKIFLLSRETYLETFVHPLWTSAKFYSWNKTGYLEQSCSILPPRIVLVSPMCYDEMPNFMIPELLSCSPLHCFISRLILLDTPKKER